MTRILLHTLGLNPDPAEPLQDQTSSHLSETRDTILAPLSRVFGPIDPWQPFAPETQPDGDRLFIVLLTCQWQYFSRRDYFIACNALALHETHRAHIVPIIIGPSGNAAGQQSPWLRRYRQVFERLQTLASQQEDQLTPAQRSGVLHLDAVQRVMAAALETPPTPATSQTRPATTLFFSYSHRDEPLRDQLAHHLKLLERTGLLHSWHDRKIPAGDDWSIAIDTHLYTADIILMLLSADFFASDFCSEIETPIALERHRARAARVIPVLLRPVLWNHSPLAALQALPTGAVPVASWPSPDSAFVNICEGILATHLEASAPKPPAPPGKPFVTRKRVIDTAMPAQVEIDRSFMLVLLVRKEASGGLKTLFAQDPTYGIDAGDVHSRPVSLTFPKGISSRPENIQLRAIISHMDLKAQPSQRAFTLTPDGDSQPIIFMLSARREGLLRAAIDIFDGSEFIVSCPLETMVLAAPVTAGRPWFGTAAFNLTEEPRPAQDNTAVRRINHPGQTPDAVQTTAPHTTQANAPRTLPEPPPDTVPGRHIAPPIPALQPAEPPPAAPSPAPSHPGGRHIDFKDEVYPTFPAGATSPAPTPPAAAAPPLPRVNSASPPFKPLLLAASLLIAGGLGLATWINNRSVPPAVSTTAPETKTDPDNTALPSVSQIPCPIQPQALLDQSPTAQNTPPDAQPCLDQAALLLAASPNSSLIIHSYAATGEGVSADHNAIIRARNASSYLVFYKSIPRSRITVVTGLAKTPSLTLEVDRPAPPPAKTAP